MQWKSSLWFVYIKRETDKIWIEGISLLIKVELSLDVPKVNQNDIYALTAKLETTNIEKPNNNLKSDNDSNQLYPEAIWTLEEILKGEHLSWLEKKEIIKLLDNKIMTKQKLWMNFNLSVSAVNKIVNQYWLNKSTFSNSRRLPWKLTKPAAVVKLLGSLWKIEIIHIPPRMFKIKLTES